MFVHCKVFAVFCGLTMHSVMNYEKLLKANARQKVALEVLSFHASSSVEEVERIMVRATFYWLREGKYLVLTSFCIYIRDHVHVHVEGFGAKYLTVHVHVHVCIHVTTLHHTRVHIAF